MTRQHPARSVRLIAFLLAACAAPPDGGADALVVARNFYAWYQAPTDSAGAGGNLERAIAQRPEAFGAQLRSALEADLVASRADSENVVGLDFDPFTASQDPCESYRPDSVTMQATIARVAVVEHCSSATSRGVPLTLEMRKEEGAWRIIDIAFKDEQRLTEVLARLKAARDSSGAPPA